MLTPQIKIFFIKEGTDKEVNEFLKTAALLENGLKLSSDGKTLLAIYLDGKPDAPETEKVPGASRAECRKEIDELLRGAQIGRITAEANLRGAKIRVAQKRGGKDKQEEAAAFVLTCEKDIEEKDQQITMFKGMMQELEEGKFDVALAGMATQKGSGKRDGKETTKQD